MPSAPADLVELGRVQAAYGIKGWVKVQPHSAQADTLRSVKSWWLLRPAARLESVAPASKTKSKGVNPPSASVSAPQQPIAYPVIQSRTQGATVVAQLQGVDDRDQAEALRGCLVMAERSAFPAPDEGEYYWVDLIGCSLYTTASGDTPVLLGEVIEVLDNGAHAILRVARQQVQTQHQTQPQTAQLQTTARSQTQASPEDVSQRQPMLDAKGRPIELLVPFVGAHIHDVDLAARRIDSDWPADY